MRWPFQSKKETDIRIFRDPKTDEITLRLVGPVCLPSSENHRSVAMETTRCARSLGKQAVAGHPASQGEPERVYGGHRQQSIVSPELIHFPVRLPTLLSRTILI
jgi:hypothetical protein